MESRTQEVRLDWVVLASALNSEISDPVTAEARITRSLGSSRSGLEIFDSSLINPRGAGVRQNVWGTLYRKGHVTVTRSQKGNRVNPTLSLKE